jgi:hypothetical protein
MEVIQDCLNDLKDNAVFVEDDEFAALNEEGIPLDFPDTYQQFENNA